MGYENPFRLAEDLATVDVLSSGRLNVGLQRGAPIHGALLGERLFDTDPNGSISHACVARCAAIWPATGSVTKTRSWNRLRARSGRAYSLRTGLDGAALVRRGIRAVGRMGGP